MDGKGLILATDRSLGMSKHCLPLYTHCSDNGAAQHHSKSMVRQTGLVKVGVSKVEERRKRKKKGRKDGNGRKGKRKKSTKTQIWGRILHGGRDKWDKEEIGEGGRISAL